MTNNLCFIFSFRLMIFILKFCYDLRISWIIYLHTKALILRFWPEGRFLGWNKTRLGKFLGFRCLLFQNAQEIYNEMNQCYFDGQQKGHNQNENVLAIFIWPRHERIKLYPSKISDEIVNYEQPQKSQRRQNVANSDFNVRYWILNKNYNKSVEILVNFMRGQFKLKIT